MNNINTQRLNLKVLSWADIPDLHKLYTTSETLTYNTISPPLSERETESLIRPVLEDEKSQVRTKYAWTIRMIETDQFIGEIGINLGLARYKRGEVHYNIMPEFWRNGFGTEAVLAILKFGFDELKLHRIEAGVAIENIASIRILEKVGMLREGRHRKILPIRGEWKDNYHYAILEEEYYGDG